VALCFEKTDQFLVNPLFQRRAHPVWRVLVDDEFGILDDLRRQQRRIGVRHDLVIVSVKHQSRHVKSLQILSEIGGKKSLLINGRGEAVCTVPAPVMLLLPLVRP
jgi:hypothetical protein